MRALNSQRRLLVPHIFIPIIVFLTLTGCHGVKSSVILDDQVIDKFQVNDEAIQQTHDIKDQPDTHQPDGKSSDSEEHIDIIQLTKEEGIRRFDADVEPDVDSIKYDDKIIRDQDHPEYSKDPDLYNQKRSVKRKLESPVVEEEKINDPVVDVGKTGEKEIHENAGDKILLKAVDEITDQSIPELIPVKVDQISDNIFLTDNEAARKSLMIDSEDDDREKEENEEVRNERSSDKEEKKKILGSLNSVQYWKEQALDIQEKLKNHTYLEYLRQQAKILPGVPNYTEDEYLDLFKKISPKKSLEKFHVDTLDTSVLNKKQIEVLRCAEGLLAEKQRQSFAENIFECIRGFNIFNCLRIFVWPIIVENLPERITQNLPSLPIEVTLSDWLPGGQETQKITRAASDHQQRLISPELVISNILKEALESNLNDNNLPSYINDHNETLLKLLNSNQFEILEMAEKFLPESARQDYSSKMTSCIKRFEYFSCVKYFAWPMIKQHFPALPEFPDYQSWYPATISVYPGYPIIPFPEFSGENGKLPEIIEADIYRDRSPRPETLFAHILKSTLDQQPRQPFLSSAIRLHDDMEYITPEQLSSIQMAEQLLPVDQRPEFVKSTVKCMKQYDYLTCMRYSTWPTVRKWKPQLPNLSDFESFFSTFALPTIPTFSPPHLPSWFPGAGIIGGSESGSESGSISVGGGNGGGSTGGSGSTSGSSTGTGVGAGGGTGSGSSSGSGVQVIPGGSQGQGGIQGGGSSAGTGSGGNNGGITIIIPPPQNGGGGQGGSNGGGQWNGSGSGSGSGNNQGGNQGNNQGGNQGGIQWGGSGSGTGNNQGGSQGGSQGGNQGGIQWGGSGTGNNQGSSQGGNQGGNQGGIQWGGSGTGNNQGGNQGNNQGGNQGGIQWGGSGTGSGNNQGGNQGGSQGGNQGGVGGGIHWGGIGGQGGNQGGIGGGIQWGGSGSGNNQGGSQGGNQGGIQWGGSGTGTGNNQGSSQGGNQGGNQGGIQWGGSGTGSGNNQGGNQGGSQGGNQGGIQWGGSGTGSGNNHGGNQGGSQGGNQGGIQWGGSGTGSGNNQGGNQGGIQWGGSGSNQGTSGVTQAPTTGSSTGQGSGGTGGQGSGSTNGNGGSSITIIIHPGGSTQVNGEGTGQSTGSSGGNSGVSNSGQGSTGGGINGGSGTTGQGGTGGIQIGGGSNTSGGQGSNIGSSGNNQGSGSGGIGGNQGAGGIQIGGGGSGTGGQGSNVGGSGINQGLGGGSTGGGQGSNNNQGSSGGIQIGGGQTGNTGGSGSSQGPSGGLNGGSNGSNNSGGNGGISIGGGESGSIGGTGGNQGSIGGSGGNQGPIGGSGSDQGSTGGNTGGNQGSPGNGGNGGINIGGGIPGGSIGGPSDISSQCTCCPKFFAATRESTTNLKQLEPYIVNFLNNLRFSLINTPIQRPLLSDKQSFFQSRLNNDELTILGLAESLTPLTARRDLVAQTLGCMQGGAEFMICTKNVIWPLLKLYITNFPEFPNEQDALASPIGKYRVSNHLPIFNHPFTPGSAGFENLYRYPNIQISGRTPLHSGISAKADDVPVISVTGNRFVPIYSDHPEGLIFNILNTISRTMKPSDGSEFQSKFSEFISRFNSTLNDQQESILKMAESLLPESNRPNLYEAMIECLGNNDFVSCSRDVLWPKLSEFFSRLPNFPTFQKIDTINSEYVQSLSDNITPISETDVKTDQHGNAMVTITDTRFVPIVSDHPEEVILKVLKDVDLLQQNSSPYSALAKSPRFMSFTNQQSDVILVAENLLPSPLRENFVTQMNSCARDSNFVDCMRDVAWPTIGQFVPKLPSFPNVGSLPSLPMSKRQPSPLLPPHLEPTYTENPAGKFGFLPIGQYQVPQYFQPYHRNQPFSGAHQHDNLQSGIPSSVESVSTVPEFAGQPTEILLDISQEKVILSKSSQSDRHKRSTYESLLDDYPKSVSAKNITDNSHLNLSESDFYQYLVNISDTISKESSNDTEYSPVSFEESMSDSLNSSVKVSLTNKQLEILKMVEKISTQNTRGVIGNVIRCVTSLSFLRCLGIFIFPMIAGAMPSLPGLPSFPGLPFGRSYNNGVQDIFNMSPVDVEKELLKQKESVQQTIEDWYESLLKDKFKTNYGLLNFEGYGNGVVGINLINPRKSRGVRIKDNKNLPSILTIISDIMEDVLDSRPDHDKSKKHKKEKSIRFPSHQVLDKYRDAHHAHHSHDDKIINMFLDKLKTNETHEDDDDDDDDDDDEQRYLTLDDAYKAFQVLFGAEIESEEEKNDESSYQDTTKNVKDDIEKANKRKKNKSSLIIRLPSLNDNVELARKISTSLVTLSRDTKNNMQMLPGVGLGITFLLQMALSHARIAASVANVISNVAMGAAMYTMMRQTFFRPNSQPKVQHIYETESGSAGPWA